MEFQDALINSHHNFFKVIRNSMNVLFVTNMYPTPASKSLGLFVRHQSEALKKLGHTIDILYIPTTQSKFNYIKAISDIKKQISFQTYDIIHAHYGLTGFSSIFQKRLPLVITYYGSDLNIPWQRCISLIAHSFSKYGIVQNKQHSAILKTKSSIIPCGIDIDKFFPLDKSVARNKLGFNDDINYILFPSSKQRRIKNYSLFRKVISLLKEYGEPVEEITFENVNQEHINLFMNAADVLLMTSLSEGSPVVIKEALACNLPIVTVSVGDVQEVLVGVDNCYVTSRNVEDITYAVLKILSEGNRSKNGREKSLQYRWETVAQQIEQVYKHVLNYSIL